ncbi:MAG: hypothetical protein Q9184_006940 [Pyrenodesmia sp. 2 TL-2023]
MSSPFAIVAGVGPGTGATVARKFGAAYPVALLARNPANYEGAVEDIEAAGGKAIGIPTDVTDAKSVKDAVEAAQKEFGGDKYLKHPPTLIFTGATAAMKGSALTAAFSTGKFALRSLSQSLAREFGPRGIHVSHVNIDGVIDIPRTHEWMKDAGPDAKIKPEAVSRSLLEAWHGLIMICDRLPTHTGFCTLNLGHVSRRK